MNSKITTTKANFFAPCLFLLVLSTSCQKNLDQSRLSPSASGVQLVSGSTSKGDRLLFEGNTEGLLYEENFEGSSPFSTGVGIENCGLEYALRLVTYPVFQGSQAIGFEIRKDQPLVGSSQKVRSEVTIIKGTEDPRFTREMWYSYSLYFPSAGMEYDATRECITQWYENGGDETSVRTEKDKAYLEVCPPEGSSISTKYDLFNTDITSPTASTSGPPGSFMTIQKDTWHEFVFHFIHSTGSDGLIEIWRDGIKIHNIVGRNMHLQLPKWKLGLYKVSFLDKSSLLDSRVLYFDNIKVGNADASLEKMRGIPSRVSPAEVINYTLVNAGTEKDIATIISGATISLSELGVSKLNIRANTSTTEGSVKFTLTGAQSFSYVDNRFPFALFGDDGNGNYYYQNYLLSTPGDYTLTSSTLINSNGSETSGIPNTINFTIAQ